MLNFLSDRFRKIVLSYNYENIYELRIRKDKNICINLKGEYIEIFNSKTTQKDIQNFFLSACSYSVYSYQKSIQNGFVTTLDSERIGLSGEFVYENGQVIAIKDITSLVVRIPHQIYNASLCIQPYLEKNLKNLMIISPPGLGKTTLLRDLALYCSDKLRKNVVVIDEKYEICSKNFSFELGKFTDVLLGVTKKDGLTLAVKNLKPDLIVLDELTTAEEVMAVYRAICSGVKVICSAHGDDLTDLKRKLEFKKIFDNVIFDYYIILENIGIIKNIYGANGDVC